MRSSNKSRSRNKNNNRRPNNFGNVVNRVFDSAGPEGKVRGTPQQIIEKYQGLYRDAQLSGDRVAAENFQQHAEHYTRMLSEAQREMNDRRDAQQAQQAPNANTTNNGQNTGAGQQPQAQAQPQAQPQAQAQQSGEQPQAQPQPQAEPSEKREPTKQSSAMMPKLPVIDGSESQPDVAEGGLATFGEQPQEPADLVATPESNPAKPKRAPRKRAPRKPAAPKADVAAPADEAPSTDA